MRMRWAVLVRVLLVGLWCGFPGLNLGANDTADPKRSGAMADDNWPEFRGPRGDGVATAKHVPIEWSESRNVRWKTAIEGKAWSSPVIWGRQIWVANAPEDGKRLSAVAVDRETGKVLFDVLVFEVAEPQFCHPMNSYASCTPAIEEGRVYVHFGSAGTACLSTETGKVLWKRNDLPCDHFRGPASSPAIYGDLLFVQFDGADLQYVVALDKKSGKTVWKRDRGVDFGTTDGDAKKAYGTPQVIRVDGEEQLVSPFAAFTIAYEPKSGKELWRVKHGGMNVSVRPIYRHGLVYLNTGAGGDKLLAVRPAGHGDLTSNHVAWKYGQGVPTRPSYLLVDDLFYMVSDAGVASCLEAATGTPVWTQRIEGKFSASPLFADGKLYFPSEDGTTTVLAPGREFKKLAENVLDEGCMASPAAVGEALYLRTRTHLYRIEEQKAR